MRFRNDKQRALVCVSLLGIRVVPYDLSDPSTWDPPPFAYLWTLDGPTPEAISYWKADGHPLPDGDRQLLLLCFALWNGDDKFSFLDLFHLEEERLRAVVSLMPWLAAGPEDIDDWLSSYPVGTSGLVG